MPTFYGPPSDGTVIPEQLETALAADIRAPGTPIRNAIDAIKGKSSSIAEPSTIIFGTSLENQIRQGPEVVDPAAGQASTSRGWFHWANGYLGQRFRMVRNAGVGGDRYDNMRTRIEADVMAYDSDWVFMGGPANDLNQSRDVNLIIADLDAMLDRIIDDGRRVLLLTAPPSEGYTTAAQLSAVDTFNAYAKGLHGQRGIVVSDIFPVLADPATYWPREGMAVDSIHYSELGAHRVGRQVASDLGANLPALPAGISRSMDARNVVANPTFRGGTGWAAQTGGDTGGTIAATYPGGGRAFVDLSGYTSAADPAIYSIEPAANGRFSVGSVVRLTVRIKWSGLVPVSVASPCAPYVQVRQRKSDGTWGSTAYALYVPSAEWRTTTGEVPESGEITVATYGVTIGADTTEIRPYIGWKGAASVSLEVSDLLVTTGATVLAEPEPAPADPPVSLQALYLPDSWDEGTAVWSDATGNGHTLVAGEAKPTMVTADGVSSVQFGGTARLFIESLAFTLPQPFTVYSLVQVTSPAAGRSVVVNMSSGTSVWAPSIATDGSVRAKVGAVEVNAGSISGAGWHTLGVVANGASSLSITDGVDTAAAFDTTGANVLSLATNNGGWNSTTSNMVGKIAAVAIAPTALTAQERVDLVAYLKSQTGIA